MVKRIILMEFDATIGPVPNVGLGRRLGKLALGLLMLFAAAHADARNGYKCTEKSAVSVDGKGVLVVNSFAESMIGSSFTVDRENGRMIGALSNHEDSIQPTVISPGSKIQSFKALTVFEPSKNVTF